MKPKELAMALTAKKAKQEAVKAKFNKLKKEKALTDKQRLSRIEEYLELEDES